MPLDVKLLIVKIPSKKSILEITKEEHMLIKDIAAELEGTIMTKAKEIHEVTTKVVMPKKIRLVKKDSSPKKKAKKLVLQKESEGNEVQKNN